MASYGRQSEMLEDDTYAIWTAQSDTSTPPISTRGTGRRWRSIAVHGGTAVKKGAAKAKTKRTTDAEIKRQSRQNVRSRLKIEQISSQSSHADTAEGI